MPAGDADCDASATQELVQGRPCNAIGRADSPRLQLARLDAGQHILHRHAQQLRCLLGRKHFQRRHRCWMAGCARQATRCALHRRHALSGHHTRNRCRAAGRPSIGDTRSVTRGEVLALKLAEKAGIPAAPARIVLLGETPIAVIRRFDRGADDTRIPYQSAATLLQTSREEDRSYTELVDAMHTHAKNPTADIQQLWRRILFNLLITNVDDHLQNHGFLHVDNGHWRLAPAFDINPFPDRERESKTWLSEEDGPITDIHMLMARAAWFSLNEQQARQILGEVHQAVRQWKKVALSPEVGLRTAELGDFSAAFEHEQMEAAATLLG